MHKLTILHASAEFRTQGEVDSVIRALAKEGYQPALRTAGRELLRLTGSSARTSTDREASLMSSLLSESRVAGPAEQNIFGDLFFSGTSTFIIQPTGSRLTLAEIRKHEKEGKLAEFAESVRLAAASTLDGRRLRGMSFSWTEVSQESLQKAAAPYIARGSLSARRGIRNRAELKTTSATLTAEDISDATLLANVEQRAFLQRLVQIGKTRSVDARQDAASDVVDPLLTRNLVRKEYLVVCKKDSSTLCTVESKEEISAGIKFRCSNCGRAFADELIQEIYAPSDRARDLLKGSQWMTLWITHLLVEAGVDIQSITWGATAGEDELDIIAEVNGLTVFFELKDREFGLGDAYPFSSRVQRYGGDYGVIISMDKVAAEVGKYLKEQRVTTIYQLAESKQIPRSLQEIINSVGDRAVLDSLLMIFARNRIDIRPLLREWMKKDK